MCSVQEVEPFIFVVYSCCLGKHSVGLPLAKWRDNCVRGETLAATGFNKHQTYDQPCTVTG